MTVQGENAAVVVGQLCLSSVALSDWHSLWESKRATRSRPQDQGLQLRDLQLRACLMHLAGCVEAPSSVCLFYRGIQGLAAAGTWAVGNAVVADVYPIEIRGQAFGIFMSPGVRAGMLGA